jgi:hypothetical protein
LPQSVVHGSGPDRHESRFKKAAGFQPSAFATSAIFEVIEDA